MTDKNWMYFILFLQPNPLFIHFFFPPKDASLSYDPNTPPGEIQSDAVFREGQTVGGHVTYTPRLIAMDLKGNKNSPMFPLMATLWSLSFIFGNKNTESADVFSKRLFSLTLSLTLYSPCLSLSLYDRKSADSAAGGEPVWCRKGRVSSHLVNKSLVKMPCVSFPVV